MNKKKLIILGTVGTVALVGVTVIPIVVINSKNSNNDKKDKTDAYDVAKLLNSKSVQDRTIELASGSTGKIIKDNKTKIVDKIKELIGVSKLRGVTIDVSMKTDADISTTGQAIVVTIKKGKHSVKVETKAGTDEGVKVKRALTTAETNLKTLKTHLETSANLNVVLPKGASTLYDTDAKVLAAIKKELELRVGITSDHTSLITKKTGETPASSVAAHGATATSYKITVDGTHYTLKLKQAAQYNNANSVAAILAIFNAKSGNVLGITLANSVTGKIVANNKAAIETELRKMITGNTAGSSNHATMLGTTVTVSMSTDANISTSFQNIIVTVSKGSTSTATTATFKVKRALTTAETNLKTLKTHLETSANLNVVLPQVASTLYNTDAKVLAAIKKALESRVGITSDHTSLITKKTGESDVVSVAAHGATATSYKITVNGTNYTLKLNQAAQYTDANAVAAILTIFNGKSSNDLEITLANSVSGKIVANNNEAIETELRKMITNDSKGSENHATMLGTTVTVSMSTDANISTSFQNIIVTVSKGSTSTATTATFKVKRELTTAETNLKTLKTHFRNFS